MILPTFVGLLPALVKLEAAVEILRSEAQLHVVFVVVMEVVDRAGEGGGSALLLWAAIIVATDTERSGEVDARSVVGLEGGLDLSCSAAAKKSAFSLYPESRGVPLAVVLSIGLWSSRYQSLQDMFSSL